MTSTTTMILTILTYVLPLYTLIYLYTTYHSLSSKIPGPLLAKFTNLHRFLSVHRRSPHLDQLALHTHHRQTSDLIRLGPNLISVSGPSYISQIYGIDKKLPKSSFYATFQNIVNGRRAASLVAVTDDDTHSRMKRLVANAYALSTLVEFEPLVDSTTHYFLNQLEKQSGEIDLGAWLQFYAFDVMGELTFSRRLGFLEQGKDVQGIIGSISRNFEYFSLMGQMPWLDECLGKNWIYVKWFRKQVSSPILVFAQKLLKERLEGEGQKGEKGAKPDFLARFLAAREKVETGEEETTDGLLLSLLFGNINAGSDTIATTLRAVFWYLFRNEEVMETLKESLREAVEKGKMTLPCPTWQETQGEELVYLRCVIKEAVRLWPALALVLERNVVDKNGLMLRDGNGEVTVLPKGTIVGINPYVLQRDPRVFDPNFVDGKTNVEEFDPARWIPAGSKMANSRGNTEEQLKVMDHDILTFSAGKRTCLGKSIAMMEMLKVVPALIMKFSDMNLVDEKRWKVSNAWVLGQTGLDAKLS